MLTKTKKKVTWYVLNPKFDRNPFSSFEYVVSQEWAGKHDLFIKP